ncbi:hypothetical protein DM860_000154 [Cuscuta australis]|uniref:LOB domain-containing protein n=1 Tax=Cuscuta australis TaxID=267555 RepID=A0A328CXR1_9ASTE|nr:hypothetical protein DM860_000154 [Cuscuta australis]
MISDTTETVAVMSPCAACKILRRRCATTTEKCVLAPYFPPGDPVKFLAAHLAGILDPVLPLPSNSELAEHEREDAVSSMVYEANARLRDPVYGCAGAVFQLQNQVDALQEQLARAQAEAVNIQLQYESLAAALLHNRDLSPSYPPCSPGRSGFRSSFDYQLVYDGAGAGVNLGFFWDENITTLDTSACD